MKLLIRKPATHYACVLILLTGLSFKTQAQQSSDSLFVFSSVKVKGIYKTFEEFRKNAPSISFDKIHVEYSEEETVYGGNLPVAILNTDSVTIEKGTPIWGFCDGSSVFVSRSNKFNKKTTYDKVRYIGRYLYYQTITSNNGHTNTTGPGASTGGYTMGGPRAQTLLEKGVDINRV